MKVRLLILALLFPVLVSAQGYTVVSKEKAKPIINKITQASEGIESLECNFTEEKNISVLAQNSVSTGKMYYSKPGKIRWEYLSPNPFLFIIKDGQTTVKNGNKIERGNSGSAMVFKEVGKIILGSISGKKIVDEATFKASYLSDGSNFRIVMVPKSSKMKQMISEIVFTFSTTDYYIRTIEMNNAGGDITTIALKDKKINKPLDQSVFNL